MKTKKAYFLIKCPDRKGLVCGITSFFFNRSFNILSCRQYTDLRENTYYMRIIPDMTNAPCSRRDLETQFAEFAKNYDMQWSVRYSEDRQRVAVLVSKTDHCLYDLLVHARDGVLDCDIPLIVSNHPDLERVADQFRIPFFCRPIRNGDKAAQEQEILDLLATHKIDLVVLARYMQILSSDFIAKYPERIINIHHPFLPAFQGGNPYARAWARGVKMIGATAHYATTDLAEGPIIEQDVERINHEDEPEDLRRIGSDIERRVLTRAVRAHLERRIIISGARTIVF